MRNMTKIMMKNASVIRNLRFNILFLSVVTAIDLRIGTNKEIQKVRCI